MKRAAATLCIMGVLFILVIVYILYLISPNRSVVQKVTVSISEGATIDDVSKKLYEQGLIRHPFIAKIIGIGLYKMRMVEAGDYTFSSDQGVLALMRSLAIGAPRREMRIVIPEGWNVRDIGLYLEKTGLFQQNEFEAAQREDWASIYPFLSDKNATENLEGFLFPDTYRIFADATASDVVRKMLANFDQKMNTSYRQQAYARGFTVREVITLASIIEREVISDHDRANVADIFYRRMKIGMPLQADSTVNYVTGHSTPQVSARDLSVDSPYNTYRHKGLPPGPICNPGLSSIRAALYPTQNEYLFFLTTLEKKTIFSKTFDEHVRNKQMYLK